MELEKAREIQRKWFEMDTKEWPPEPENSVLLGLQMVTKYHNDPLIRCEREMFFVGGFTESVSQMTEKEFREMLRMGWYQDEEERIDCWCHLANKAY